MLKMLIGILFSIEMAGCFCLFFFSSASFEAVRFGGDPVPETVLSTTESLVIGAYSFGMKKLCSLTWPACCPLLGADPVPPR